jgi:VIT1/CCC1 family predicted Fe2+/Mn2+ transporter
VTDSRRVLDPVERVSEVLFGLIMVLTFTGSMSAASSGRAEVKEMLIGALGCNLAWGIVDAVMYILGNLLTRARGLAVLAAVRRAPDAEQARATIAGAVDPYVASLLTPGALDAVGRDLVAAPAVSERATLTSEDVRGAFEVCLLVFLSTFPVTIPFILFHDVAVAMRVSNAVAVAMLCLGGYSLGRYSGLPRWGTAAAMTAIGGVLVAITMALGG